MPGRRGRRLWLVAAAAPAPGPAPWFPGPDEGPDAAVGLEVPADLATSVRDRVGRVDEVVRGPGRGPAATCQALSVEAEVDDDLRPPSFGTWAGRPVGEVLAGDPESAGRWRSDPTWAPPGGESLADLCGRMTVWLAGQGSREGRALVVADAAVVRAIAVVALGAGPASAWHLDIGPLTAARVQCADGGWRLRALHPDAR